MAMTDTHEVERIEAALADLLIEMHRQDALAAKQKGHGGKLIVVCAADIAPTTRRQGQIDALMDRSVRAACKNAIRLLGERLHELGLSLDEMQGVAEGAAAGIGNRVNIIDKAWNGVGSWMS